MTLAELLESRFRRDLRFRGEGLWETERVAITRVTPEQVHAVIQDNNGIEHQTQLCRVETNLFLHCNCPRCSKSQNKELACKYLWATILGVDAGGFLTGPVRQGQVPPFAYVTEEVFDYTADAVDEDDLLSGEIYEPPAPTAVPKPTATEESGGSATSVKVRLRDWEQRLRELKQDVRTADPAGSGSATKKDRAIYYEIDVTESRSVGRLVVQTSQRQRRANGQWGKLKALKLRPGQLDEIDSVEDRRILAYLSGGLPERTNWLAQQSEAQSSAYRYRIPQELCELLLPLMCGTERVRLLDEGESAPALVWDDGPPWELTMRVARDDEDDRWRTRGELHRPRITEPTAPEPDSSGETNGSTIKIAGDQNTSTEPQRDIVPLERIDLLIPGGLVIFNGRIARLDDFDAFRWVDLLAGRDSLTVPDGEEQELVDQLFDMPILPKLELPEELKLEEVRLTPEPHLVIQSPSGKPWQWERLKGEVQFDYDGVLVPGSSPQWAIVQREENRCLMRNREYEETCWDRLRELGFRRQLDHRYRGHDVELPARELGGVVRALMEEDWQIRADGKQVHQPLDMKFRVKSNIDWFELHADIDFGGQKIAFPELLQALQRGDSTIRLADGSLGILPEEWLQQYGLFAGLGEVEEDHLNFSQNQVALLDALLSSQPTVDYDTEFLKLRERFAQFQGVNEADEPSGFTGELRGYQREGLGWLHFLEDFHFGGCLADDMGLGKTVQILALLQRRRRDDQDRPILDPKHKDKPLPPALVVVPKSLLFNWRQEAERFTPTLAVLEYTGLNRAELRDSFAEQDLILTTYGTLRRDIVELKEIEFDYVILDEAQTIKNAGSQVAKAARLLNSRHRVALSGTPVENHLGDLWSIFEFLNPNMLGHSAVFKTFVADTEDHGARKLLGAGLRPFILRRTKKQVAVELPEKTEQTIYCDLGPDQRKLYDELRDHYRQSLLGRVDDVGLGKSKMHVLEALLRLRQAACHPALLQRGDNEDGSAKLDVLCPHLEELIDEGHKSLVFSQFTSMLTIVREHLDARGIQYEYLDGQTRDRQARVEKFQNDPDCKVFLISLKAGGLGLNLTAAEYVFLLDPWWNPAVEAQAIDRAHRVGQTNQVFAYRLIARNTVEEKIAELQAKKRSLAEAILEADDKSVMKNLTADDLEMLLS